MIYRFGSFELDESAGELRREGRAVTLQPKPLELLRLLVRERDRIVPLDELFACLWPGTAVTPGSLTRAVSLARRAIDDTHKGSLIRSFPKRGYRFMGEVFALGGEARDGEPAAPDPVRAPRVAATSGDLFVGREGALTTLDEAWRRAAAGRGQLVIVQGPPGVGKTRLVEVFAQGVASPGRPALMARGRDDEGVPAFWLWTQVLRRLAGDETARSDVRSVAAAIPELLELMPGGDESGFEGPAVSSPDQARFLFFDGVHRLLARRSRQHPLLLLLDDIQWAGEDSLRLLEHLVFEMADDPILVVATLRDEPRLESDALGRTLAVLRQRPNAQTIGLAGFSRREVAVLLEELIGRAAPSDLISELVARTEGIPLFVREAVRVLAERGDLAHPERIARHGISLPQEALELIRRTVRGLSTDATALVGAASVLGRAFSLRFLAAVVEAAPDRVLGWLDEAAAAGVVEPVPDRAAVFRFVHALHREAAYSALSTTERTRLHYRAAQQLERTDESRLDRVLGELAHHHFHSIAVGDPQQVYRRSVQAAERAASQLAYEEAAVYFEHALAALDHDEHADAADRLETLLRLGEAHRLSGDRARRRAVLGEALDLAVAMDRREAVARAAIGICDLSEWGVPDESARDALEKALAALGGDDGIERARILTRIAYLEAMSQDPVYREMARDAARRARDLGDAVALQEALYILHFQLAGPDHLDEREAISREIVEAAAHTRRNDAALIALIDTACDFIMRGDAERARARFDEARQVAGERPHTGLLWHLRGHAAGVSLMEGRLDEARSLAEEAMTLGQRIKHPYAQGVYDAQMAFIGRSRGEHEGVLTHLEPALRARQGATHWVRAVVARAKLALGERDAAERLYHELRRDTFGSIPRNMRYTNTLVEVGHLCADLEAADDVMALCKDLGGIESQHGVLPIPVLYGGPVTHALGRLRALRGEVDEAVELLDESVQACRDLGAHPARALAEVDLARLLLRRGDRGRAAALQQSARKLASEIGMEGLIRALDADAGGAAQA